MTELVDEYLEDQAALCKKLYMNINSSLNIREVSQVRLRRRQIFLYDIKKNQ